MNFKDLTEPQFVEKLNETLSPSSPIRKTSLLKGREEQKDQIFRAFHTVGRQVFIYGDRGVGKSSLAFSMANELSSEDIPPIVLAASHENFASIICDLLIRLKQLIGSNGKKLKGINVSTSGLGVEFENSDFDKSLFNDISINQTSSILSEMLSAVEYEPVVVIDEFDQLSCQEDREKFASLIKHIGDLRMPIKIFFTGIGKSIKELLTAHHSCYRYITAVELEPLSWDGRLEFIDLVADAFDIDIDRDTSIRISAISDGFPHYIHLICQQLLWVMFEDDVRPVDTSANIYRQAVDRAVKDVAPELQETYEKATQKYKDDYAVILWAVADHYELRRPSRDIFQSYTELMQQLESEPQTRAQYNTKINALKKNSHAEILVGNRSGWYEFSEPFIRGYVRLQAEKNGVELAKDHPRQVGARHHQLVR